MRESNPPSRQVFLRRQWKRGRIGGRGRTGLLILGLIVAAVLLLGENGFIRRYQLQRQHDRLQVKIAALRTQEEVLVQEEQRLLSDAEYREKIAREEWGYKESDETVYYLRRKK